MNVRFIRFRRSREREEVAPLDRVRRIGLLNVYEGADPDEVIRRIRSMSYGSTSSEQVKLRIASQATESFSATQPAVTAPDAPQLPRRVA